MRKRPAHSQNRRRRAAARRRRSTAPKGKRFVRSTAPRATPEDVKLISGRKLKIEGGDRLYWRVLFMDEAAGHVTITCLRSDDSIDASIDVQLNQQSRGRGIGTIVFRQACEMSGLDEVAAAIRKSNLASRLAAERAGFVLQHEQSRGELLMIWRRA